MRGNQKVLGKCLAGSFGVFIGGFTWEHVSHKSQTSAQLPFSPTLPHEPHPIPKCYPSFISLSSLSLLYISLIHLSYLPRLSLSLIHLSYLSLLYNISYLSLTYLSYTSLSSLSLISLSDLSLCLIPRFSIRQHPLRSRCSAGCAVRTAATRSAPRQPCPRI